MQIFPTGVAPARLATAAFRLRVAGTALTGARRGHGDAAAFEREISIWEAIIHGDRAGHP